MQLNVSVGDQIFHVSRGPGTVVRVNVDGGFEVQFANRGAFFFQKEGTSGGSSRQEVFHLNPIFINPPRDVNFWNDYVALAKHLYETMAKQANVDML